MRRSFSFSPSQFTSVALPRIVTFGRNYASRSDGTKYLSARHSRSSFANVAVFLQPTATFVPRCAYASAAAAPSVGQSEGPKTPRLKTAKAAELGRKDPVLDSIPTPEFYRRMQHNLKDKIYQEKRTADAVNAESDFFVVLF